MMQPLRRGSGLSVMSVVLLSLCAVLSMMLLACMTRRCGPGNRAASDARRRLLPADADPEKIQLLWLGGKVEGWNVVPSLLPDGAVVYSVGAGEDISFDIGMLNNFPNASVFLFDMTPKAIRYVQKFLPDYPALVFTEEGLALQPGTLTFALPADTRHVSSRAVTEDTQDQLANRKTFTANVNTLETWMWHFGHSYVDVLKMDIEHLEYEVLENWLSRYSESPLVRITQLLVELHVVPKPGNEHNPEVMRHTRLVEGLQKHFTMVARHMKHYLFVRRES